MGSRRRLARRLGLVAAFFTTVLAAREADAFCGFYVSGADTKLYNNATHVVLMREGTKTVLSMQNNYEGPPEGFAMVVPVPVVLQKANVKTLSRELFEKIDELTAPRLVEYWEQDPCGGLGGSMGAIGFGRGGGGRAEAKATASTSLGVTVEAQFDVGEYEIVILSAKDSGGLDTWLKQESYKIPEGAEPYFRPYVQSGSKFFVARVDPKRVKFDKGQAQLSPLRFHYDSAEFSLPVRLGLINSRGSQDLIINILASERYEPANYPSVTIPTNLDLAEGSKEHFARFYAELFDRTLEKTPKSIVTEYSWDAGSCDPCPGPALWPQDFAMLGADVVPSAGKPTNPQVTIERSKGSVSPATVDLIARRFKSRVDSCWSSAQSRTPKTGAVDVSLAWGADGKVTDAKIAKNETGDQEVADCVKKAFDGALLPNEAGSMTASYDLTLVAQPTYQSWTVTRLHARYSKESLGEDIVFRKAKAIQGGREEPDEHGKLSITAKVLDSGTNNFQGRYAIRHPWIGPLDCKEPHRGVWGGPWYEPGMPMSYAKPIAAERTAFVPRGGGVTLASFVRTDVPDLGVKAGKGPLPTTAVSSSETPTPSPSAAASDATPTKRGCGGCAVASSKNELSSIFLALSVSAAFVRRRRARSQAHR